MTCESNSQHWVIIVTWNCEPGLVTDKSGCHTCTCSRGWYAACNGFWDKWCGQGCHKLLHSWIKNYKFLNLHQNFLDSVSQKILHSGCEGMFWNVLNAFTIAASRQHCTSTWTWTLKRPLWLRLQSPPRPVLTWYVANESTMFLPCTLKLAVLEIAALWMGCPFSCSQQTQHIGNASPHARQVVACPTKSHLCFANQSDVQQWITSVTSVMPPK